MKRGVFRMMIAVAMLSLIGCGSAEVVSVADEIAKAQAERVPVLLVVSDSEHNAESMTQIVQSATEGMERVRVFEMKSDDQANSELIEELSIKDIPLPITLVISDRGIVMNGLMESDMTPEIVKAIIPSRGLSDISYFLNGEKSVIVNISAANFVSDDKVKAVCSEAKAELGDSIEVVEVLANSQDEAILFEILGIKGALKDSRMIVINKQGAHTGDFATVPTATEVVEACQKMLEMP